MVWWAARPLAPNRLLDDRHRAALVQAVEDGPIPAVHGVIRWRIVDLCQWLRDEFEVTVSKQTLGRELRALGYRKLSARPRHHAQAVGAIEAFKKSLPACLDAIGRAQGIGRSGVEVWFADEARVGQKNKITRRWAKRGTRPSAPQDQRTASAYIFGAICPETGAAAGLVLPWCNIEAMDLHLAAIAAKDHAGQTLCTAGRPGRMAHIRAPGRAAQHHHRAIARQMPRG